ncbi:MAG: DUF1353 domain-containing protein [Acidimicrobiales bacterium]
MASNVAVTDRTAGLLASLVHHTGQSTATVAEVAVRGLYRALIGEEAPQQGIPFKKRYSDLEADVVLRQETPTEFRLEEPFRFISADGKEIVVPSNDVSDLASVPDFLTWLVPRYGRHTLPAVLHDHLVRPGIDADDRERYDAVFRDAMGDTQVPFIRRWVMWSAVSIATHLQRSWLWKVAVAAWVVVFAGLGFGLFFDAVNWWRFPVLEEVPPLALAASPFVLALLWGRRYRFGLISGCCLLVLPVPVVGVGATLLLYLAAEEVAKVGLHVKRGLGGRARINPVRASTARHDP